MEDQGPQTGRRWFPRSYLKGQIGHAYRPHSKREASQMNWVINPAAILGDAALHWIDFMLQGNISILLNINCTIPREDHMANCLSKWRVSLLRPALWGFAVIGMLSSAHGQSLVVSDPFLQWYNAGPNDLSFSSGDFIRYGATDVTPNGFSGTVADAVTTNLTTGASIVRSMSPITRCNPKFFQWAP